MYTTQDASKRIQRDSDIQILSYLEANESGWIYEIISTEEIGYPPQYIRYRCSELQRQGLIRHKRSGDYAITKKGLEYLSNTTDNSLPEFESEKIEPQFIEWISPCDKRILDILDKHRNRKKVSIDKIQSLIEEGYAKEVISGCCRNLQQIGLINQVETQCYRIGKLGRRYLAGEIDKIDIFNAQLQFRDRIAHRAGVYALQILDWLDPDFTQNRRDLNEGAKQAKAAFLIAFRRRFYRYLAILIFIGAIVLVDVFVSMTITFRSYGFFYDFLGAGLLARAIIRGKRGLTVDTEETAQLQPTYSISRLEPAALTSTAQDTVDGIWGIFFLSIGYIMQIAPVFTL